MHTLSVGSKRGGPSTLAASRELRADTDDGTQDMGHVQSKSLINCTFTRAQTETSFRANSSSEVCWLWKCTILGKNSLRVKEGTCRLRQDDELLAMWQDATWLPLRVLGLVGKLRTRRFRQFK